MTNKTSLALVAALVAGSAVAAHADSMWTDVNTGLPSNIYNAPLAELQAQGLPISDSAKAYLKAHSQGGAVRHVNVQSRRSAVRSNVGYDAVGYTPDDKQS